MEPERNIEKELRAYAQQRRAEAGPPRELHPATRKLLQDEAARLGKTAASGSPSAHNPPLTIWLRLALGGFAVALAAIAVWFIYPGFSRDKTEANRANMSLTKLDSEAPATEGFKNEPLAQPKAMAPRRREIAAPMAAPAPSSASAPAAVAVAAAPPPAATPAPAPSGINTNGPSGLGFTSPNSGLFGGPPPAVSADRRYALYGGEGGAPAVVQSFRRANSLKEARKAPDDAKVLGSFRVEQAFQKLRMIDSDGSIYSGFVERTPESSNGRAAALEKKVAAATANKPAAAEPPLAFRFRVSGTNRTFNEEVVFTGTFLNAALPQNARAPASSNGQAARAIAPGAASEPPPLELHNASLSGSLLLGGTNNIEINAVPVKP